MEVFASERKFDYITHLLFPSRTLVKDMIYWSTELAAAIILFIYIVQMQLDKVTLYKGVDATVDSYMLKKTDAQSFGLKGRMDPPSENLDPAWFGISMYAPNHMFTVAEFDSDLLNREYAWICLCYIVKHALYFFDFATLFNLRKCKQWDLLTPLLNLALWVLWGLYGWLHSGFELFGGMYLRFRKDVVYSQVPSDSDPNVLFDYLGGLHDQHVKIYQENVRWEWLWLPSGAICLCHLALWLVGLFSKRSSAFTGQAFSTVAVAAQLTVLHLFMKGSWIRSNWATQYFDTRTALRAAYTTNADYFEARWVFFVVYFGAWAGVVLAAGCMARAACIGKQDPVKSAKYALYSLFFVSAFIWVLMMDATLYHFFIRWRTGLIVTHVICMVFALVIAILSLVEKSRETDKLFLEKHEAWPHWWDGSAPAPVPEQAKDKEDAEKVLLRKEEDHETPAAQAQPELDAPAPKQQQQQPLTNSQKQLKSQASVQEPLDASQEKKKAPKAAKAKSPKNEEVGW